MRAKLLSSVLVLSAVFAGSAAAGPPETISIGNFHLDWLGSTQAPAIDNVRAVALQTSRGEIAAAYYPPAPSGAPRRTGVVWVGGAGGHGPEGPPDTIYPAVCEQLQKAGIAGLRLQYRRPNYMVHCVFDTLCGIAFLADQGIDRIALVGHSFGGAVVISAGALSPRVKAVVPISSQTDGTDFVSRLSPRSLLLIHGTADRTLPSSCSEEIYAEAREPKELRLMKGAGHDLAESRQEVIDLLARWLPEQLAR